MLLNFSPARESSLQRVDPRSLMILIVIPRWWGMEETTPIRQGATSRFPILIFRTMIELGQEMGESMIDRQIVITAGVVVLGLCRRIVMQGEDPLIIVDQGRLAHLLVLREGVEREREKV